MKTSLQRHLVVLLLVAVAGFMLVSCGGSGGTTGATPTSSGGGTSTVAQNSPGIVNPQVALSQVRSVVNGRTVENSRFGQVVVTCDSASRIQFFNMIVGGNWCIQNVPIMPFEGAPAIRFFIDLGVPDGTAAPSPVVWTNFSDSAMILTPEQIKEKMDGVQSRASASTLPTTEVVFDTGVRRDIKIVPRGGNANLGSPTNVRVGDSAKLESFPLLEQGHSECGPSSVAAAMQSLNRRFNMGLSASQVSIDEMKKAVGYDGSLASDGLPVGSPGGETMAKNKAAYMTSKGIPVSTEFLDGKSSTFWDNVLAALRDGGVVELGTIGHYQAVVGVTKLSDGSYAVFTADDLFQGQAGGTTILGYTSKYENGGWSLTGNGPIKTATEEGVVQTRVSDAVIQRCTKSSPTPSPSPSGAKTDISSQFSTRVVQYRPANPKFFSLYLVQSASSSIAVTGYEVLREDNPSFPFAQVSFLSGSILDGALVEHFDILQNSANALKWQRGINIVPRGKETYLDANSDTPFDPLLIGQVKVHVLSEAGGDRNKNAGYVIVQMP